jgi:uncharacterized protein (TIGR00369 family)
MLRYVLPLIFVVRPALVYDLLRKRLGEIIPLNKLIGVEIDSIGDGVAQAHIPFRPDLANHIGSLHATAIFGVAEAASGAAMSGAFAPIVLQIRPVAASATVTFSKIARSDVVAQAAVVGSSQELRDKLVNEGRVVFDVAVQLRDSAGSDIATMTVAWHVTKMTRR